MTADPTLRQPFALSFEYPKIVPNDGEEMGGDLRRAADLLLAQFEAGEGLLRYYGPRVARLYLLAAEAFEAGASVSIGHNRTDRYMSAAKELRGKAAALANGE